MFKFLFVYFLMYEIIVLFNCEKYVAWNKEFVKKDNSVIDGEEAVTHGLVSFFVIIPYTVFMIYLTAFGSDLKFYLGVGLLILSLLHYFVSRKVKHYSLKFTDCLLTIALFLMYILELRNIINLIN